MELEIATAPAHEDEGYVAPDVERLGTAEALTDGITTAPQPADASSILN